MVKQPTLKSPYPYFGGKSRIAHVVWKRFGNVVNYVEPFYGSGAVLLGRTTRPGLETVNDIDGWIINFWRAVARNPNEVAKHADWPPNEIDLLARNKYLVEHRKAFTKQLKADPEYFDAKLAGWWVWGQSCWIGAGWASSKNAKLKLPHMQGGEGIHRTTLVQVNSANDVNGFLYDTSKGIHTYFSRLSKRMRRVRVACGNWDRVLGPSVTYFNGITGLLFDPPYAESGDGRSGNVYAHDDLSIAHQVREWCITNGDNKLLRIALCGYWDEHNMPDDWEAVRWKASGGFGSQGDEGGRGRENSKREVVWFSPHCLKVVRKRTFF